MPGSLNLLSLARVAGEARSPPPFRGIYRGPRDAKRDLP